MVKKLMKYETLAYLKIMTPMLIILLATSLFTRVIQFFENGSDIYGMVFGSSVFIFVITILVSMIMVIAVGIVRFYKNLFTSEGYLSFTLPVTPFQHIFAKLIVAVLASIATLITVFISVCIATSGEMLAEIFKAIAYLFEKLFNLTGVNGGFYIVEILVLLLISTISQYLLFYACISIGQLAGKKRVLLAFGAYFGYYILTQIFVTILGVVSISGLIPWDQIVFWILENATEFFHILFCSMIVISAALGIVFYIISSRIIKKKLNLE